MMLIPDDPIIACIQRTGYAPWYLAEHGYFDDLEDDEDDESEEYDDAEF